MMGNSMTGDASGSGPEDSGFETLFPSEGNS